MDSTLTLLRRVLYLLVGVSCWVNMAWAQGNPIRPVLSQTLVGSDFLFYANAADTLKRLGARFGVEARTLRELNGFAPGQRLAAGDEVRINNQHIVPDQLEHGILVNLPQRMLYLFLDGALAGAYPVAVGRPDWQSTTGDYSVLNLQVNKTWIVPKSIQQEMRREGKQVKKRVPPGPKNPLGKYWIGIDWEGYGIHSTIAPDSIYGFETHGCLRMYPDDIEQMFPRIRLGMPVRAIYQPVLMARFADGRIFVEIHRDAYKLAEFPMVVLRELADAEGLADQIDWLAVAQAVTRADGLAHQVSTSFDH